VADPAVAAVIEQAHRAAVEDALAFIEQHALFSRTGPQGIRQVNVRGLVATAFTHRDSRAGDPDLHTHVAVANKVQTLDGRWLSIDGRVLFKANVAASETYNTALEPAALVDLLIDEVVDRRSVALAPPADNIEEPDALRRVDRSSVYTVAGADLYTSQRILDAEARLVAAAGRYGGVIVEQMAVDLALLEMAANGTALDAGQAFLLQQMCTSGARLQLAIAPACAGKTTAMRALAMAWTQDGGHLLGLAPSAAGAAALAEQTGIRTDTLAKLTWSLQHSDLPDWAAAVGPSTLVIIDEAGMADTLSLDTAVQFAINRGASVRLVGDDQQLGAIGAGGVLRDIKHSHGALHLTELHRFTDPAEAAATIAIREGKPAALNFYLDHGRVHVGELATTTHDAFAAWVSDRTAGLDTIMLAPTRKLVDDLNRQAVIISSAVTRPAVKCA
jgi:hypothetical protein